MTLPNSYIDVTDATTILTNTVGAESWLTSEDAVKTASLIQATELLDSNFNWNGSIAADDQILRWPRTGCYDRDGRVIPSDTIPNQIKNAVASLASHLVQAGGISSVSNNVKSIKVGPISIGLDSEESVDPQVVPRYLISALNFLGDYVGPTSSNSAYNVKVIR